MARRGGRAHASAWPWPVVAGRRSGSSGNSSSASSSSPYGFNAPKQASSGSAHRVGSTRRACRSPRSTSRRNPNVKLNIVTYDGLTRTDSNTYKTKTELFDRASSGWPDVAFTADNNSASWGSEQGTGDLAPVNKGLVPSSTTLNNLRHRLTVGLHGRRGSPTASATTWPRTCSGTTPRS